MNIFLAGVVAFISIAVLVVVALFFGSVILSLILGTGVGLLAG